MPRPRGKPTDPDLLYNQSLGKFYASRVRLYTEKKKSERILKTAEKKLAKKLSKNQSAESEMRNFAVAAAAKARIEEKAREMRLQAENMLAGIEGVTGQTLEMAVAPEAKALSAEKQAILAERRFPGLEMFPEPPISSASSSKAPMPIVEEPDEMTD